MVFLEFEVGCSLESEFEFAAEFFAVGKIELVFLDEELAIHLIGRVFDKQLVFVAGEDDADGWVVAFGVFLGGEVAEVEIHLADVVVLDFLEFQIDKDEASQDAVVKDEIDAVVGVVDRHAVLAADEGEAFAEFQKKGLEVIAELRLQIGLVQGVGLGDFEEFEDIGIAQEVAGFFHGLALAGELEDLALVLPGSESQKKGGFLLALELWNRPSFFDGLLFVKSPFQVIIDSEQLDIVRPTQ